MDSLPLKPLGKSLLLTYSIFGAAWLWNETSPLGWWTLKPRTKEEKKLAHLYERREFPYPGDEEAVREFIKKGGSIGTTIGPKGFVDKSGNNPQKKVQEEKFERESQKLWLRMRSEALGSLCGRQPPPSSMSRLGSNFYFRAVVQSTSLSGYAIQARAIPDTSHTCSPIRSGGLGTQFEICRLDHC